MLVKRIDPFDDASAVAAIVQIYREAFGGEPWNEGYRCPVCETTYPLVGAPKFCPSCAQGAREMLLVEYWPTTTVLADFYREMARDKALCLAACEDDAIIGFAWGYQVTAGQELDQHLDAPSLSVQLEPRQSYFYLDECALRPDCQGRGLGKGIFGAVLLESRENPGILRTLNNSRMCSLAESLGARVVQHISRDRVIMQWSRGLGAHLCK